MKAHVKKKYQHIL